MNRYLVAATAIMLIAAACSSSNGEATPTTAPTTTGPTRPTTTSEALEMEITSPAFEQGDAIPLKHSCDGENISPRLDIANLPPQTVTLVLIMDDPDAPGGTWDHWIAYDIGPTETIEEANHTVGIGGLNSWSEMGYGGPCPPSGVHRYLFKILALDAILGLPEGATKTEVLNATEGHVLTDATLVGTFTLDE